MTPPPPPLVEAIDSSPTDRLLQLHIAEYNALTTRSTYYIIMAASLIPVLIIFLALVATIWKDANHVVLIWTAALVTEFFWVAMLDNSRWQYENIKYVEQTLRQLIQPLVGQTSVFWQYEQHLAQQRKGAQWWEYAPACLAALTVIGALFGRLIDLTSVRLKVEQNQLVAGIAQVVFEVRRLKCP